MGRAPCCEKVGLKRGRWTAEEDEILNNYIKAHGEGAWRSLPKNAGLLRCGKSCRLRWVNYLKSDLRRGNISAEEENVIMRLHSSLGNRWSLIAAHLPGRTDNEIKNHWNSHLRRRILPTRQPTNPTAPAITITSTVNKHKDTIRTGTRTSYKPSTITNHNTIQSDHEPQTKQQTKVDPCANSTYEDELLLFIENIMDQDLVAMVDDNGEPMSAINAGKEGTGSVISEQVEVGCTSSSTTITREAFDDWNWDFSVEDGVLGFGGEEDDKILSWPWESSASIDSIIDNM